MIMDSIIIDHAEFNPETGECAVSASVYLADGSRSGPHLVAFADLVGLVNPDNTPVTPTADQIKAAVLALYGAAPAGN